MLNQKDKNIELKFGEKYLLNSDKYYYCIPINRCVKFKEVVVELTARPANKDGVYFGKLINTDGWDFVSENEITFLEDDVIELYKMKDRPSFFYYMPDF